MLKFRRARGSALISKLNRHDLIAFTSTSSRVKCEINLTQARYCEPGLGPETLAVALREVGGHDGEGWSASVAILAALRQRSVKSPCAVLVGVTMRACALGRAWRQVLCLLQDLRDYGVHPNSSGFDAAVVACVAGHYWSVAGELLKEMLDCGVRRKLVAYNISISTCEKLYRWEYAIGLFHELQERWLSPDAQTFNFTMSACSRGLQLQYTSELFNQMRCIVVKPDSTSYGIAMMAHPSHHLWAHAASLVVAAFDQTPPSPSLGGQVYGQAMHLALQGGAQAAAFKLFEDARKQRATLSTTSYNSLMHSCGVARNWQMAWLVMSDMLACIVEPTSRARNILVSACARGTAWQNVMEGASGYAYRGGAPDRFLLNAVIHSFAKRSDWEAACQTLLAMSHFFVCPDVVSFTSCINACGYAAHWQRALQLLYNMQQHRVGDVTAYNSAIRACASEQSVGLAFQVISQMYEYQVDPDNRTFNATIGSLCREGSRPKADFVLRSMHDARMLSDVMTWDGVLGGGVRGICSPVLLRHMKTN